MRCASDRLALRAFALVVTPYLILANITIHSLAPIAIHTEHLESSRKVVSDKPSMHHLTSDVAMLASMSRPVVVNVIDAQKHPLRLSTTAALPSAICLIDCFLDPITGHLQSSIYLLAVMFCNSSGGSDARYVSRRSF
jgi:hypothetical protein